MTYFIVKHPTPILNTPYAKKVFGKKLPFDEQKLVREVEMIALPGMVLELIQEREGSILEVVSEDYCSRRSLFVDARFGVLLQEKPFPPKRQLPPINEILQSMKRCVGLPYIWGGNFAAGIPKWKELYPPGRPLSKEEEAYWCFRGVDCSGLLYEAVLGLLPRNTSELIKIGVEVEVGSPFEPLDLIHFPGHVSIVLNENEVIESRLEFGGVRVTPLKERLENEEGFIVKRFHPHAIASQK